MRPLETFLFRAFGLAIMSSVSLSFLLSRPVDAALGELSDYAFVASRQSSDIMVLSTKADRVVTKLELPAIPSQMVVSENQRKLIAIHTSLQAVNLVDLDSGVITKTIDLGFEPERLQIDDDANVVAISGLEAGKIVTVSLDREEVMFVLDEIARPTDLMFNRDGRWLYVTEQGAGAISIFDAVSGKRIKRLVLEAVGDDVVELVRTPGGKTGLALHGESGLISALDLDQGVQVDETQLPGAAFRGFPSANSQYFIIPNGNDGRMSMVSSWTYRESISLPAPKVVSGVNHAMFDTVAFALGAEISSTLSLNLMDNQAPPSRISLPGRPETGLTVDAGKKIYVALSDTHQVAVIDAATSKLITLIDDVGEQPWAITAAGGLGYCH